MDATVQLFSSKINWVFIGRSYGCEVTPGGGLFLGSFFIRPKVPGISGNLEIGEILLVQGKKALQLCNATRTSICESRFSQILATTIWCLGAFFNVIL